MPLDLQLHRIQKLLSLLKNPHHKPKFIHIAGTNGKGSVCSYISHVLTESGITNGKFNSPHLITARDSIQIDNHPVSSSFYEKCRKLIVETDEKFNVGCTEFELLTCTAFQIFAESEIPIAIMEVGVGGRLDATNVIPSERTIVTGITKIALDHQALLGNTLAEIAYQKVGIFKQDVPSVIDGSNCASVIEVARKEAKKLNSTLFIANRKTDCWIKPTMLGDYQYDNLAVALKMIDQIKDARITKESTENGIRKTKWPGRLQEYKLSLNKLDNNNSTENISILLDGAHNSQAALELGKYLDLLRKNNKNNFIFVIAITKGKDISTLFKSIITSNDNLILTEFNRNIEGMPWIQPTEVLYLKEQIEKQGIQYEDIHTIPNVRDAIKTAYHISLKTSKQVVVCGSLYLVGDILRL